MSYTIRDIALMTGVSKSTVSRVISGNGYTSEKVREKVLNAIEELRYRPNGVARAMVSQRTNNLGVIIYRQHYPIVSHPVYGKILDAILMKAESLNYSVFVTTDKEMSLSSADFMLEKRVDGLILISRLSKEVIHYIDNFRVPYLMVNGTTDKNGVIQIINDDRKGGSIIADHFYQLGHRHFYIIAGPQEHRSHNLRLKGFLERIGQLGGAVLGQHIYFSPTSTFEDAYRGFSSKWDIFVNRRPTAIFATNDLLALGAMKVLHEKGVKIPEDVAIAGFDNIDFAHMSYPPLTTIHVDKMKMGEDAVLLLDGLIHHESMNLEQIQYDPKLIIRNSTIGDRKDGK